MFNSNHFTGIFFTMNPCPWVPSQLYPSAVIHVTRYLFDPLNREGASKATSSPERNDPNSLATCRWAAVVGWIASTYISPSYMRPAFSENPNLVGLSIMSLNNPAAFHTTTSTPSCALEKASTWDSSVVLNCSQVLSRSLKDTSYPR